MPPASVADHVALLAARRRNLAMLDRKTGLPYSWSTWMRGWAPVAGAFGVDALAGVIAARPRVKPALPPPQTFAQALLSLLRWHGDDPPPRDQRGIRWLAVASSVGLHLLFAVLLLWVALVRSNVPEAADEAGERVRVEYVGRGTPQEEGGGAPQAQGQEEAGTAAAPASASMAAPAAEAAPAQPVAVQTPAMEAEGVPVDASRPVPEVPAEQPLQVTEVVRPTTDFVLPEVAVAVPEVRAREPQVRERAIETAVERPVVANRVPLPDISRPEPRMPQVQVRERPVDVVPVEPVAMAQVPVREAEVQMQLPAVREREVEVVPRQPVVMGAVPAREIGVQVKVPEARVRERPVPGVAETPSPVDETAGASASRSTDTGQRAGASASAPGSETRPSPAPPGSSTGAGPQAQDRSGGWATPARGDDWGAASRQVAGNAGGQADAGSGLFNADGSVRLPGDDGRGQEPRRGAPGGDSDSWTRERIAQSGTWLKRPPYDYTPTSFDKYWVPNESLLAEWVRKGIKNIEIPIPGTSTRISCVVSMLQFGGGCGLSDPNMQEQKAEARPPPDIPFKPELQEDNGSR